MIYPKVPWNGLEDVEFATLAYVDWFNSRLHGQIVDGPGYTTPAAFEVDYNCQNVPAAQAEGTGSYLDTVASVSSGGLHTCALLQQRRQVLGGQSGWPTRRGTTTTRTTPVAVSA